MYVRYMHHALKRHRLSSHNRNWYNMSATSALPVLVLIVWWPVTLCTGAWQIYRLHQSLPVSGNIVRSSKKHSLKLLVYLVLHCFSGCCGPWQVVFWCFMWIILFRWSAGNSSTAVSSKDAVYMPEVALFANQTFLFSHQRRYKERLHCSDHAKKL